MNTSLFRSKVWLAGFLVASSWLIQPAQARGELMISINTPPPPMRVERVAVRPGYIWAPGYWDWRNQRYSWMGGHWERERPGYRWTPHRWDHDDRSYHFRPGAWERATRFEGRRDEHREWRHEGRHDDRREGYREWRHEEEDRHDRHDRHDHGRHEGWNR